MRITRCWLLIAGALLLALVPRSLVAQSATTGFAVVELFTSQGCSSCPPADAVLQTIDAAGREKELPIYVLSMHVDYWNYLGWADPYSHAAFTNRQRRYARAANSKRIYTPQMIVNGQESFVGSNRAEARAALQAALAGQAAAEVTLDVTHDPANKTWRVDYQTRGARAGNRLVACLVADAAPNRVTRGENSGETLSHAGVVRAIKATAIDSDGDGSLTLAWPDSQEGEAAAEPRIVAFVQDPRTLAIRGATQWRE